MEFTLWDPKNHAFGFARDISLGGALVETAFPARPGAELVVRAWPSGWEEEVLLTGIVRWRTRAAMGVAFLSVGPREAAAIHALVERHRNGDLRASAARA